MRRVLIVSNGTHVSNAFVQRFPTYEINVISPGLLPVNEYEGRYNLIVLDVLYEEIPMIKEPLKMMCRKFKTPIVVVTDSFADVLDISKRLAIDGPFPVFVKPVDAEIVVSLGEAYACMGLDDIGKRIFSVSDEAIKQADKCRNDFSCLSDKYSTCLECTGKDDISGFLRLKQRRSGHCSYLMLFGQSYFCQCPVRLEIYQKYNV